VLGSLLFCPTCGTLLNLPKDKEHFVTCEQCGHEEPASSYVGNEVVTYSHPDAFPSVLRQKRKTQTKNLEGVESRLKVTERCPECGHAEAWAVEKQMRSADEGSTILYNCVACDFGWRVNN
ncbi:hypothetical protein SISSUDRAFT_979693, partial [Sistotremastrum suecicum HHB10207 ss-3]